MCRELQTIMKARGFYKGDVNGIFDAATKSALQGFMGWENYDARIRQDNLINKQILQDMKEKIAEREKTQKKKSGCLSPLVWCHRMPNLASSRSGAPVFL